MHFAKQTDGSWSFSSDEFLTAQHIQSFFQEWHTSCITWWGLVTDIRAAQEEQEFCDTRQIVLDEVQVQHRIAYNLIAVFSEMRTLKFKPCAMVTFFAAVFSSGFR